MGVDHSDYQSKIFVRQKALKLIQPPYRVIELYAGSGILTANLWAKIAQDVLSIEKEPGKFNIDLPNVTAITDDCTKHLGMVPSFNIIDCDAYGLVLPVVLKCIDLASPDTIVFFTEFNPIRYSKDWEGDAVKKLASHPKAKGFWYKRSDASPVLYGYILI